ncbi:MAG: imidazole glycerol phosphate synthase subunit HisH [Methanosaeta sp. PtaB.Bin039]|nr:MAG: imidazole glycerol phosphate synthase subunit HisH [Methanosaeta sp. PtaB.Bin039]
MIAIVDYGMGNLFSIYNALVRVSGEPMIVTEPDFSEADGIVVPGVGSFGRCMEQLARFGEALRQELDEGKPVLGICIGMQVLFDESAESPGAQGLAWMPGKVVRLPSGMMVPQMGWNDLRITREIPLLDGISSGDRFYFVHSYHCRPDDRSVLAATVEYGTEVVAVVENDNLAATQFHPEKSGPRGLRILENFVRCVRC